MYVRLDRILSSIYIYIFINILGLGPSWHWGRTVPYTRGPVHKLRLILFVGDITRIQNLHKMGFSKKCSPCSKLGPDRPRHAFSDNLASLRSFFLHFIKVRKPCMCKYILFVYFISFLNMSQQMFQSDRIYRFLH